MTTGGARVHIYGDWDGTGVKKAQQDLGLFQQNATGFKKGVEEGVLGPLGKIGIAFAGAFAVEKVVDFFKQSAEAAIVWQKDLTVLGVTLKSVGSAMPISEADEFLQKLSLQTGVAQEELAPALSRLVRSTRDVGEAQTTLNTAVGISIATG